ncbi:MAG: glycosyltransferase family 39 protein [Actinobacteria bacterium]|nr:glycosyltransferase family 39 protein [Actinomycetota bacterium]
MIVLAKGVLFASAIPAWEGPDEPPYFLEISMLAEKGHFTSVSGHPLLYAVAAYLPYKLSPGEGARFLSARLVSVLFAVAAVWLAFLVARELFPDRGLIQVLAPAIVTFNPQFTYISASVNSDAMLIAFSTLAFYIAIRIIREGLKPKLTVALLLTAGAGIFTKQRFLIALIPLALATLYGLIRHRKSSSGGGPKWLWVAIPTATALGLATAAVPGFAFKKTGIFAGVIPASAILSPFGAFQIRRPFWSFVIELFRQFWGYLGQSNEVAMATSYYWFSGLISLLALAGLILVVRRTLEGLAMDGLLNGLQKQLKNPRAVQMLMLLVFAFSSFFGVMTYEGNIGGGQGRYLFVSLIPHVLLISLGLAELVPKRWHFQAAAILIATLAVANLDALLYTLLPLYY